MLDVSNPGFRKTRSYEYSPVGFDAAGAKKMSGLDYMRAPVEGRIDARPSIIDTMGMSEPSELACGKAVIEVTPADFLLNPLGFVRGGFAATLLDSVMGGAVHTASPPATGYTTEEGRLVGAGDGKLYAHGATTCFLFPLGAAAGGSE
ncbi:MAG: hypothetical protein WD969_00565 [Paracoccaceae bacterium]